jgi:hypothetical protein
LEWKLIPLRFTAESYKKRQNFNSRLPNFRLAATYSSILFHQFTLLAMKNLLLLAALVVATTEVASAAPTQTTPTSTMTKKERKAARQAARQAKAPQVYKGTVAEQSRVITDAPGAEDSDNGDNTTKSKKKSKSKE